MSTPWTRALNPFVGSALTLHHIPRYRHNPWRAPGTAPVFDPCGKAGGGYPGAAGPGAADFINTTNAKHGDLGSEVLKPGPSQATWKVGSEVEVVWGLRSK